MAIVGGWPAAKLAQRLLRQDTQAALRLASEPDRRRLAWALAFLVAAVILTQS